VPEIFAVAEVQLWGRRVGAVSEETNGRITFEYDPAFARSGLEISPIKLPLSITGPLNFDELRRLEAFAGLPGVLADALPDRFGNAIIRKYFEERGRAEYAISPVQKLLYMGSRAMGALEFRPALRIPATAAERQSLELGELMRQARVLIEGKTDVVVPEIMRIGSSAGGARAKAVILWNRDKNEIRSAFVKPRQGDEHWLIKLDGVGELGVPNPKSQSYNRIEYAYSLMARDAGIDMPPTQLLEERGFAHLMVKRFDRSGERKLHMHSLGGMQHIDYNVPGLFSYEQYLRTVLALNLGYEALEQAYRRAIFNVLAVNQDDHVKNLSFLMEDQGRWLLAPAYDLTFARGLGYTRTHQITLAGKSDGFTGKDLLSVAVEFGIKQGGKAVLEQAREALKGWERDAKQAGVPASDRKRVRTQFRRL